MQQGDVPRVLPLTVVEEQAGVAVVEILAHVFGIAVTGEHVEREPLLAETGDSIQLSQNVASPLLIVEEQSDIENAAGNRVVRSRDGAGIRDEGRAGTGAVDLLGLVDHILRDVEATVLDVVALLLQVAVQSAIATAVVENREVTFAGARADTENLLENATPGTGASSNRRPLPKDRAA